MTADHQGALAAALDQIDVAFGKSLTPEQRRKRTERELAERLLIRDCLAKLAEADVAKDRDEQGWSPIDPVTAYVIAWYLRKEADSDYYLSESGEASDALTEVAEHIKSGEILACPQEMLAEMDEAIAGLRAQLALR